MARIRTVKPALFRHHELWQLERETGLPVRLAFIALWTACDREGRFHWRPEELKLDCLPYDDVDFSRVLDAWATRGFVVKYASHGKIYGYVPGFVRHQVINNRESPSDIPPPDEIIEVKEELTRAERVDDACGTRHDPAQAEGKGREGKGKDIPTTSGDGSSPSSFVDLDAEFWRLGAEYVGQHTRGDPRALLGKWRKVLGAEGAMQMLKTAQVGAISDLVPWCEKYISAKMREAPKPRIQAVTPMGPAGG